MSEFVDPLLMLRPTRGANGGGGDCEPINLRDVLRGCEGAFLVCGGPSLAQQPYRRLAERGVWSLGVNNVSGFAPVRAHLCSDPPAKFHHGIWLDPAIWKFIPSAKIGGGRKGRIRYKQPDGSFYDRPKRCVRDCPSVFGFARRSWLACDETFFTDPEAAWGNHDVGARRTGEPKTVCTMLLALRVLYYLGVRRIFLAGVDFQMMRGYGYSFNQGRTSEACNSNNAQFAIVNDWLCRLRTVFERFGLECFNCNDRSGLRAFDYVPFEEAMGVCKGNVPAEPFDLSSWYEK